ncbi:MAG: alpha/beta fold hydrolase [Planctomycetaceae bacterium]|nr:alpha/beta fold hydrolase [Planctomycetaceae bacterium]
MPPAHSGDDWRKLYPFASHYLPLDAGRYHYLDEGRGETLLLVHGNPTWSFYWRNVVRTFRDRYRLVAPDHLGCGLSDKPANYDYRLAKHIDNLTRLVDTLDLRQITLMAHDWGGAIGMGVAARRPERFARFVLCNTAAFRSQAIPRRIAACRIPVLGQLAVQGFNGFARAALRMATEHPEKFTPAVQAGYLAPYDTWAHRIATHRFVLDIPLDPSHPSYETLCEVERGLAKFRKHPMLLIWGMRDWCFTPAFLERFLEFFPYADVQRANDAGHYVIEDASERIPLWLTGFLQRHPLAQAQGVSDRPS